MPNDKPTRWLLVVFKWFFIALLAAVCGTCLLFIHESRELAAYLALLISPVVSVGLFITVFALGILTELYGRSNWNEWLLFVGGAATGLVLGWLSALIIFAQQKNWAFTWFMWPWVMIEAPEAILCMGSSVLLGGMLYAAYRDHCSSTRLWFFLLFAVMIPGFGSYFPTLALQFDNGAETGVLQGIRLRFQERMRIKYDAIRKRRAQEEVLMKEAVSALRLEGCLELQYWRDRCLDQMAKALGDITICGHASNKYERDSCYNTFVEKSGELEHCLNIQSTHSKDRCFFTVARMNQNKALCDLISDPEMQAGCKSLLERNHMMSEYLNKLVDYSTTGVLSP